MKNRKVKKIIVTLLTGIGIFTLSGFIDIHANTVQASSVTSKSALSKSIKGHIWSLDFLGYDEPSMSLLFFAKNGTLGLGGSDNDLRYFLNKQSRHSFTISDYWLMNGSTGIAPGNKVLAFSNKYKIKGRKLLCRFHLHFKGNKGDSKAYFDFDISKLKIIDSKHIQGQFTYIRTNKGPLKDSKGLTIILSRIS